MFLVQISLFIVTFLSLISLVLPYMQTTIEVNPHPRAMCQYVVLLLLLLLLMPLVDLLLHGYVTLLKKALTHTRITWALSPTAPQVPGVTLGCPQCFGHSSWRGARQGVYCTTVVIQKSSSLIILHHLHKAHIECHGYSSASLLHPKLP